MKHIYLIIIALLVLVGSAKAQVTIYSENFSIVQSGVAANALPTGYTASVGSWSRTNQSAIVGNDQISGGFYLRGERGGNGNNLPNVQRIDLKGIKVKGYSTVRVKWADIKTASHSSSVTSSTKFYYSIDGGPSQEIIIQSQSAVNGGWAVVNNGQFIAIPNIPSTANYINFYWTVSMTRSEDYFGLDDIMVTADRTSENDIFSWATRTYNENPFTASGPTAQNPYTLDFVPMRLSKTTTGTTVLDTESVRNERFQTPNKTLTLVQTGATATQGSTINIVFDDNIADFKFTLFDVDQQTGQFQDQVVITAVNSLGDKVVLKNENVIRGASISFNETTSAITGMSGQDIVGSSDLGDVVVTFPAPVKQITIAYYNLDQTRTNQGLQGIGIYNISGRAAGIITPLPVELTSFKGQRNSHGVNLTWATASELDNKGFEVQTSADGRNFKTVAFVESKVGTTSLAQNYSFVHKNPVAGTNYYRLRQLDFDGTFEFSKTIALKFEMAAASSVYPTMATEQVTVKLLSTDEQVTVRLSDMNGRQIVQVQNPSERELVLPVSNLQQGMYFVTIMSGSQKETFRIMKR